MNTNERLAALEAELAELKGTAPPRSAKPYQPIDYTAGMTLDAETLRALAQGVERVPGEVAREQARPVQLPSVAGASSGTAAGNWVEPRPLTVPGIAQADRIADHFAALDRHDLAQRLGVNDEGPKAA